MRNPKEEFKVSVSQAYYLSGLIKRAIGLILKDDSGSCSTEAIRLLLHVCDFFERPDHPSGSSTDKNSSAASGSSQ